MIKKILTITWLAMLLLLMVFTTIMYGSSFAELKQSTGNFLSYYIIITLLLGTAAVTLELIKALYKRVKMETTKYRMLSKYFDVAGQGILLIIFVFSVVLFGSIFSGAVKSLGIFLAYFIFIMLLLLVLITIRGLVKAVKKKA